MSHESIDAFVTRLAGDRELRSAVARAVRGMEGEQAAAAVARLAAEHGYRFTAQEAMEAFGATRGPSASGGELDDADLEVVAGGVQGSAWPQALRSILRSRSA